MVEWDHIVVGSLLMFAAVALFVISCTAVILGGIGNFLAGILVGIIFYQGLLRFMRGWSW